MGITPMQSSKQCALLVTTKMDLWCGNLSTWAHDVCSSIIKLLYMYMYNIIIYIHLYYICIDRSLYIQYMHTYIHINVNTYIQMKYLDDS